MNIATVLRRATLLLGILFASGAVAGEARTETLPGDSIYRLDLALVDQDGRGSLLRERRGTPMVIAMFYSSCPYMCPLIIESIKRTERALDDATRAHFRVMLVSFDSARDTPPVLKKTAAERHIDLARWTLARADAAGVRRLAAVLDVQYRELPDGGFNHSGVLTLLDGEGRIVARSDKLGDPDPAFLAAVRKALGDSR